MKYKYLVLIAFVLGFQACSNDEIKGDYAGLSELETLILEFENDLVPLEKEVTELSILTSYLIKNQHQFIPSADRAKFTTSESGIFYNHTPKINESSVYISTKAPDREAAIAQAYATELLDSAFYKVVTDNNIVTQAYFNSKTQYSRLYPSYGVLSILEPDLDITSFNFYSLADGVRNPDRGPKWVEDIYIDPAGRGWVMSVIHPVYVEEVLQGVVGIDITVDNILTQFLNRSNRDLVIVNAEGMIVAGKNRAIESLDMPPLKNHTYSQTINADNFQEQEFNLFKSKNREVRRMVAKFFLEKDNNFQLNVNGSTHQVYCKKMTILNWYLIDIKNL
jgi:hypothetical protein